MVGIMDDYNDRLEQLHSTLHTLIEKYDRLPDAAYQVFSLEAEIRGFEQRKDKLNLVYSPITCNLCKQKITDSKMNEVARLGKKGAFLICHRCIKTMNQVKGTTELERTLQLSTGTVKQDCEGALKALQAEKLIRKSEKSWLVHEVVSDLFYKVGRRRFNFLDSWIKEMSERLSLLKEQKHLIEKLRLSIPDSHTQILSLQFQIEDLEKKLNRIHGGNLPYRCSQCGKWANDNANPIFFGTYTICSNCKEVVSNVMTTSEAEKKHGLGLGTIRRDNHRGLLNKYKENGLFRQSGKIWLIHDVVILDKYKELHTPETPKVNTSDIPSDLAERAASIFNRVMESKKL